MFYYTYLNVKRQSFVKNSFSYNSFTFSITIINFIIT